MASAGHVVLAYDHRNFGDSDGEPRQELDPWLQVRDYRHAITFAQTLDGVDPDRVGIWGTSYAGGHVLVVGAIDRRVGCVVAQVPTISGWQSTLRRIAATGAARPARRLGCRPPRALPRATRRRWCRWWSTPPRAARPRTRARTRGSSSPASTRRPRTSGDSRSGATRSRCDRSSCTREYEPGVLHRADRADAAADGGRRQRRRLPHRPRRWRPSTAPASPSGSSSTPAVTSPPTRTSSTARRPPPPRGSPSTSGRKARVSTGVRKFGVESGVRIGGWARTQAKQVAALPASPRTPPEAVRRPPVPAGTCGCLY